MEKAMVRCADVLDVRDGTHDSPQYVTDGYPLITSKNIKDGEIDFENVNYIKEEDFNKINMRSKVDVGDILMPMIGTIGNPVVVNTDKPFAIKNVALFKFTNQCDFDSKFVYYVLKSPLVVNQLNANKRGGTQAFVSLGNIRDLKIPNIPLELQKKVVNVLDKAKEIIDKRKEQIETCDELIKSQFIKMFGDPYSNEKGWKISSLNDITTLVTYGLTVRPEFIEEGIDLVSAREIRSGTVDYDSSPKISEEDFEQLSDKAKPLKDEILFSKTGSIGHCALIKSDRKFAVTQNAARIVLDLNKVNPVWVLHYLKTDYIQNWCQGEAKGNAVKDFQIQDIKRIPFFECNIELQNEFAQFVQQVDKLKFEMEKSLEELENNFNALMQKAFKGELFN